MKMTQKKKTNQEKDLSTLQVTDPEIFIEEDKIHYVYRHRRLDDFSIFYVGMGKNRRAYAKSDKTAYWKNIVNKHGYQVEIVAENLSRAEAGELEILLIKQYGRYDLKEGRLTNLTDGGEGAVNPSPEQRKKTSERVSGENNPMFGVRGELHPNFGKRGVFEHSQEFKDNLSVIMAGGGNPAARYVVKPETEEIFECAKEVSNKHGWNHSTFCYKLRGGKMFNDTGYLYLEDYLNGFEANENYNKKRWYVDIINVKTLEIYRCGTHLAEQIGMKPYTFLRMIRGAQWNTTDYMLLSDYNEGKIINEGKRPKVSSRAMPIINVETGEIYERFRDVCEEYRVHPSKMRAYLRGNLPNPYPLVYLSEYNSK